MSYNKEIFEQVEVGTCGTIVLRPIYVDFSDHNSHYPDDFDINKNIVANDVDEVLELIDFMWGGLNFFLTDDELGFSLFCRNEKYIVDLTEDDEYQLRLFLDEVQEMYNEHCVVDDIF